MEDTNTMLEEKMRDAEKVDEPGELAQHPIIHKGDEMLPAQMTATMESAGYVYIYNTKTGDRSLCNRNMLARKLQQKRPDGSFVFTTVKPKITPRVGTYKCPLHRDALNRKHYDDLGFPVCSKDNLLSPFHVRRHTQKRHKIEWSAMEEERLETEKQEEREFQRQLISKASEKPPLYISDKDKAKIE